jgi:hypothetical protein
VVGSGKAERKHFLSAEQTDGYYEANRAFLCVSRSTIDVSLA